MLIGRNVFNKGFQNILGIGGGGIKSVQSTSGNIASSATTASLTLSTAVNTSNTILVGGYATQYTTNIEGTAVRWGLTGATTVTLTRGNNPANASPDATIYAIEFNDGQIASIEYTTVTVNAGSASATQTITSVTTANSIIIPCGASLVGNPPNNSDGVNGMVELTFNSGTQIQATRTGTSSPATTSITYGVAVVEWVVTG